LARPH